MASKKKSPLNHDTIISAALLLSETLSVHELTLQRIADALGVTPMALYRYYHNKEELLSAMLDRFIRESVALPEPGSSWQQCIIDLSESMFKALSSRPSWLPLLGKLEVTETGLQVIENFLAAMRNAGFDDQQACDAFFAMAHCVIGAASMSSAVADNQLNADFSAKDRKRVARTRFENVPEAAFPNTIACAENLALSVNSNQLSHSLNHLIYSLENQLAKC